MAYNFCGMLLLVVSKSILRIFVGTLRDLEVEELVDISKSFVMDTVLFLVFYSPTIGGKEVR